MGFFSVLAASLNKNKKLILFGAVLYLAPVIYRFATKSSIVPILNTTLFLRNVGSQVTPVNLEMLGITFILPTAVGAIVGTTFLETLFDRKFAGLEKYLARVFGSLSFAFAWIVLQFLGYSFFNPMLPWGTHLWAGTGAYARNLLIALILAPLVPYAIEFIYRKIRK